MTGKPWQRKNKRGRRAGAYYGSRPGKPPISLQTTDPKEALQRLRQLRAGTWQPAPPRRGPRARGRSSGAPGGLEAAQLEEQEAAAAAAAMDESLGGEAAPASSPEPAPAPPPAPAPAAAAPTPGETSTIKPDAVLPPPATTWNEDAAAAADDAAGDDAGDGAATDEEKPQYVSPDEILNLVAQGVVEGGKIVGKWIARRQKKIPNEFQDPKARQFVAMIENATSACTKQALVDWAPLLAVDISPGWGMLAGFGVLATLQFIGAPPDPNAPDDDDDGEK